MSAAKVSSVVLLLLLAGAAQAQGGDAQRTALLAKAHAAVQAEDARQKAGFCLTKGNNYDLGICMDKETKRTEANYLTEVRALGELMRMPDGTGATAAPATVKRLPFDDAESLWQQYRTAACQVVYTRFQGGTGAAAGELNCQLKLTGSHMRELLLVYEDQL